MCQHSSACIFRSLVVLVLLGHVICTSNVDFSTDTQQHKLHTGKKHRGKGSTRSWPLHLPISDTGIEESNRSLEVSAASSPKTLLCSSRSRCSKHIENRRRHRQKPRCCGSSASKGQTSCHPKRRDRRRRSRYQHHKRRKHKRKRGELFRVVRVSASSLPINKRRPTVHQQSPSTQSLHYSHHLSWVPIHQNYKLERPQHSSNITSRGLPLHLQYDSKWYGRWSRWSPCSISCTTQRFRWCKRPAFCRNGYIREVAYCYIEGSFCQRWIYRQIQQQNDEENEADVDGEDDSGIWSRGSSRDGVHNGAEEARAPRRLDCGIANHTGVWSLRRIIGGHPTQKGRWPWQVAILNRFKEAFCGGTLIDLRWVLTAAHCVRKRLYVRLGEHDLDENEGTELEFRVELAVTHPGYDADTVDNDVALLRLPVDVRPDKYRGFACLPRHEQELPPAHRLCTIIGWGKKRSSDAFGTDILHEATVPIVASHICRNVYMDYHITDNMFCAGYERGRKDSCAGDSGGPLLCQDDTSRWTVFGITSFGEGCGKRGKFGIYTKLPNYVKWIHSWTNKVW